MVEKVKSIVAKAFFLRRSGTYQKQFNRNFATTGNFGALNALSDAIMSNGLTTITPTLLANSGSSLISLEMGVNNLAGITLPNDWNNSRGIFILSMEVTYSTGGSILYFVQGYTDSDSFTNTNVDPNMRFYINNVITAMPQRVIIDNNPLNSLRMATNYQSVVDFNTSNGFTPHAARLMRPQDIFGQIKNQDFSSGNIHVTDDSGVIGNNLQTSRRRNNNAGSFASAVFNGFNAARKENEGEYTTGDTAEQAFGVVMEADGMEDIFIRQLQTANGLSRLQSSFTYGQLRNAVPNIDMVKNTVVHATTGVSLNQVGDSQHFAGQTKSTEAAVNIATAIPSIMLECMLSSVTFLVSNMSCPVLDIFAIGQAGCFAPDMWQTQWLQFSRRVMTEVFGPMTDRGRLNINAVIECSFHGEIVITIRIGDDPETRFVAPTFCDSLFAPTVTTNPDALRRLSTDMSVMCDSVSEALGIASMAKDRIVSKSLTMPMTGALAMGGNAFSMPTPVNAGATSMGGLAGYPQQPMAVPVQQAAPTRVNTGGFNTSGPSSTSM